MNFSNEDTPEKLKDVIAILEKSMEPPSGEEIPPLPEDLRKRLLGQYGELAAEPEAAREAGGFWQSLASLFARPAYAGGFAALVLAAVVGSMLMGPKAESPEGVRGGDFVTSAGGTLIILYSLSDEQVGEIRESGYFDESLLKVVETEAQVKALVEQDGASLLVDGKAQSMNLEDGEAVALPDKAEEIPDAITELLP